MFWNKILEIFKLQPQPISEPEFVEDRYIKDLKLYDDVYLKINDIIYLGWVSEIGKNTLSIVYDNEKMEPYEHQFVIKNLKNQKILVTRKATLILNKRDTE